VIVNVTVIVIVNVIVDVDGLTLTLALSLEGRGMTRLWRQSGSRVHAGLSIGRSVAIRSLMFILSTCPSMNPTLMRPW